MNEPSSGRLVSTMALASVVLTPALLPHSAHGMYDPKHGRWLQRDPAGYVDGINSYEYVKSMPTIYVDLSGTSAAQVSNAQPQPVPGPNPAKPKPPPEIVVRHRLDGKHYCGSFNLHWAFYLQKEAPEDGYLVQHVTASAVCARQNEKRKCGIKQERMDRFWFWLKGLPDVEYWEAWPVEKRHKGPGVDHAEWPSQRETCGFAAQWGEVRFFRKSKTGDLQAKGWVWGKVGTFKDCFNLSMTSGVLLHTTEVPDFWKEIDYVGNEFGSAIRYVVSSWNCCGILNFSPIDYFPK